MATSRQQGSKVVGHVRTEESSGMRIDPGPHIAIVKHVYDPGRTGRLMVYIPQLGGDPENPNNQRIVQYASPFAGHTNFQYDALNNINVPHDYRICLNEGNHAALNSPFGRKITIAATRCNCHL